MIERQIEGAPIDAVIAWVDGNDPAHRHKLDAYLATIGQNRPITAHPTRFSSVGEIDYCVTSILRRAPWIRTIHIVTDAQVPPVIEALQGADAEKVCIVDHREIFAGFPEALPTFNARSIGSVLWRIPGLSDRFLYLNDDFFLLQPVQPSDFFFENGVVLRGEWKPQAHRRWFRRIGAAWKRARAGEDLAKSHGAQELAARMAGYQHRYLRLFHSPYAMRRSTLQSYFDAHPQALAGNVRDRLRASRQFRTECLAAHLELAAGTARVDTSLRTAQLKPREQSSARVRARMRLADQDPRTAFGCVQSLEMAPAPLGEEIVAWLDRRVGRLEASHQQTPQLAAKQASF